MEHIHLCSTCVVLNVCDSYYCPSLPILRGRGSFCKNFLSSRDESVKRTETGQGWENSRTLPPTEQWLPPLWPPTQCTCIPISLCCVQSELQMQVHCFRGQTGGRHRSVVGSVVEFSHLYLVSVLLLVHPYLKWIFYVHVNFSPSFCLFLRCFWTNIQIQLVSPRYHTADEHIHW